MVGLQLRICEDPHNWCFIARTPKSLLYCRPTRDTTRFESDNDYFGIRFESNC